MKHKFLTTAAAAASAALISIGAAVAYAPDAQAGLITSCNGTAEVTRVKGSLVVPKNATCELINVTVDGDISVKDGGTLIANKGRYKGDVRLGKAAVLDMIDGRVDGTVDNKGGSTWVVASQLNGDYKITEGERDSGLPGAYFDRVTVGGKIDANTPASVFIQSSNVAGSATSQGTGAFSISDSQLQDSLTVENAEDGVISFVCESEIYGDARFSNNPTGPVIGPDDGGCGGMNYFGKNLTVESNGYSVVSNSIVVGDLSGDGNEEVRGHDNRVRGEISGQFVDLKPEDPNQAEGSQSAKSQESQPNTDDAKKAADERRTAAKTKAQAAGKAF